MDLEDIPEPDRLDGAPHPRAARAVWGHDAAEHAVVEALGAGRLHHAWLITGPRGIGKATFAWRMARHLLAVPPDTGDGLFGAPPPATSLDVSEDHPVARRILALSEPGLLLLRRPWDPKTRKLKTQITAEETRKLKGFFAMSAAEGGRRVVLIDAADDMNPTAANAVLKILEEPPANAVLLLICHQPSALLPTIRSRCRQLKLGPLAPEQMTAALEQAEITLDPETAGTVTLLAEGSVGAAVRLAEGNGATLYGDLVKLMTRAPDMDRPAARRFADAAGSRDPAELAQSLDLIDQFLVRLARTGALGAAPHEAVPGEANLFAKLAPSPQAGRHWAVLHQDILARARRGAAVNLDPAALILDTVLRINAGAGQAR